MLALCVCVCGIEAEEDANAVFNVPLSNATRPRFLAICAELSRYPVTKGAFEQQKTIKALNRTLSSSGVFIISAGDGMVWDTRKPFPSIMAVGEDFITQSTPGGTKTRLSAQGNETFVRLAAVIRAVFTGNPQQLLMNFTVFFTESGTTWRLGLVPKDASIKNFAEKIMLNGGGNGGMAIQSIVLLQGNGDTLRYTLTKQTFSATLRPEEKALFNAE
jgi:outer membrane lipoprotein-sorting protein